MDAKCPKCERVASLDEEITKVSCSHCGFEADYDAYIEIMREQAVNMASDYIPDRPGF